MRPSNSVLPSALVLVGLFTGLAGCGADTGSAPAAHEGGPALAGKAVVALDDARTVRVTGSTHGQRHRLRVDLRLKSDHSGTLRVRLGAGTVLVTRTQDAIYLKGDQAFWKELVGSWLGSLIPDGYVRLGSTDELGFGLDLDDMFALKDRLAKARDYAAVTLGPTITLDGVKVIALRHFPLDEPGTGRIGTLYVAAEGTPFPVRLTADGDDLTFSEYGRSFEVTAPDDATDLTALN